MMNRWCNSILVFLALGVLTSFKHPYHVNVIEIRHHSSDSAWQVTVRVFTHEWEESLRKSTSQKVDLKNSTDTVRNNALLSEYLNKHFSFEADGVPVNINWIGFENRQDETWCYLEGKGTLTGNIKVTSDILYEHGHEQQTIVHLYANGKRFSRRVNAPEKSVVIQQN